MQSTATRSRPLNSRGIFIRERAFHRAQGEDEHWQAWAGRSRRLQRLLARSSSQVSPWVKMLSVKHSAENPASASCITSNTISFTALMIARPPVSLARRLLLFRRLGADETFADFLVVLGASVFHDLFARRHKLPDSSVLPGLGVRLRVLERDFVTQGVMVGAREAFHQVQLVAHRMAASVEDHHRRPEERADGIDDHCVSFPATEIPNPNWRG